ncbi:DNA-binding transcriptional LysR family regulator [Kribbella sp. VKM Ac-2527]|uniref:DNA-binding transcriptional LysR family regulator n=1 Tax=Kribbella caucasensis TaxID=2512215 RepID=A0A4R6KMC4_9ACTN|nr:LysR family transcriptional regulator [Kribbella sp. VKM Ac-2527]TDO52381.1 DNA-binding transcriptional LysR family regulator [Kribbella sp. VKM Ac-2527]
MDLTAAYGYRLDWIVSFVAVARYGGFSAAAKAVFRGQSRISEHVAELEKSLGVQLFDRTAHPVALTPERRALLPAAEEILHRLGSLATTRGEVRFGAYPSAAAWLFPQVAVKVHEVRLLLVEGPSIELERALVQGEIDLAIRPIHPLVASEALEHHLLWREPLVAVFAENHPLAASPSVSLNDLSSLPLISIGEASGGRQFESHLAFASAGLNPESVYRTNQPQTLLSLVRHGLGTGVTNLLAVTTANLTGVRLVPIHNAGVERQVALFLPRHRPRTPALNAVIDAVTTIPPPHP